MSFADLKAKSDGRSQLMELNLRSMVKAGKVGPVEQMVSAAGGGGSFSQNMQSRSRARDAYRMLKNWVFAATNVIAKRCAGQQWLAGHYKKNPKASQQRISKSAAISGIFRATKSDDQHKDIEQDPDHEVLWLLEKPNRIQGRYEFIHITVMNLLLTGEWYWIGGVTKKGVVELWAVPSSWIVPNHSKGLFGGYKLVSGFGGEGIDLPPENVVRGYFPDPSDIKGCLSPLASCPSAANIDDYILRSQESSFQRGINPNLIITVGRGIAPDGKPVDRRPTLSGAQRRQIIRTVRHIWSQTVNQGDPAILDGMIEDVKKLQNTPQEMDWKQSGEVVKARIFQAFSVNPIVVGEITPSNKAQAVVAEKNFCKQAVNPILSNISSAASEFFSPFYEDGETLAVWLEKAEADDDERDDRNWQQARSAGDVTQEENRKRLNLEPLEPKKERSTLFNNPQVLAAITNLGAQVTAGAISHDNAVAMLMTTLQISKAEAEKMVPDDPPEPTPEELAMQQAMAMGGQAPGKPAAPPAAEEKPKPPKKPAIDSDSVAKRFVEGLITKWEEEQHPRDEQGRFTDSPGQTMLPTMEDVNQPNDDPKAMLTDRAKHAVKRSQEFVEKAIEDGETVQIVSSWDDIGDNEKSEIQSQWENDNISEFTEKYIEEWHDEVRSEKQDDVERDTEFAKEVFLEWAVDQGFTRDSADEAYQGQSSMTIDVQSDLLQWDTPNNEHGSAEEHFDSIAGQLNDYYEEKAGERVDQLVEDETNGDTPDSIYENAQSDASEAFGNLSDSEKLEYAGVDTEMTLKMPSAFEVLSPSTSSERNYKQTKAIARYLQNKIMETEMEGRGIVNSKAVDVNKVASDFWSDWKASSTSENGLLLQYATAQELGGHMQQWDHIQMQIINQAARDLSFKYGGHEGAPTGVEKVQWHIDRGMEIAKAHVHGTWAASQYVMEKAGIEEIDVYRAIKLENEILDKELKEKVSAQGTGAYTGTTKEYERLPNLSLKRNGAQSTTTNLGTANSWGGIGTEHLKGPSSRVVMRITASREAIVSLPVFGQNIHEEKEVVLAGTGHWKAWDAWLREAPRAESIEIRSIRRIMVKYNPDQPRDEGGRWTDSGGSSGSDGIKVPDSKYSGWKPAFKESPKPKDFIDSRDNSTRPLYLSKISPEDLKDHKLFLSGDGKVGAAVSPDGDVQNVFNNGGPKGAATEALIAAINAGGNTLDCYDDYLPHLYHQFGFEETGRMKFNRDYAPPGWDYEKLGEPDVVFMARKGGKIDNERAEEIRSVVAKPRAEWPVAQESGTYYDDWDQAKADSRGAGHS